MQGVDLIRDCYDWLMGERVQLVLLGSGRADLEDALRDMEARWVVELLVGRLGGCWLVSLGGWDAHAAGLGCGGRGAVSDGVPPG